jgi:hypothetical protein
MEEINFPVGSSNFKSYSNQFPALLLPAWKMQSKLRDAALGDEYWKMYTKRVREQIESGEVPAGSEGATKTAWLAERRIEDEANDLVAKMEALAASPTEDGSSPVGL